MRKTKNKLSLILIACLLWSVLALPVIATKPIEADAPSSAAVEIAAKYAMSTGEWTGNLSDGAETTFVTVPTGGTLTVESEDIGALYVKFHLKAKAWTASVNGEETKFGADGLLHEYAVLPESADSVTMTFGEQTQICEIRVFTAGDPPTDVQVWQKPHDKADVMLLSSHSDDEQLFFAGLIPHCIANDVDIQVIYFCYHDDVPVRLHEQLNGLWAAGMRHYPVIGRFPDLYSESLDWAVNAFAGYGYNREDFVSYQCEMIRRFKPEIVVAHDVNGEYGHGTHRLNTDTLREALELTADAANYPESANTYGTWDVPKTYVHLWEERPIVMNYDIPLDYFGGKTAYEMSVAGYGCHNSQHWTWFTDWLVGTDAAPITAASQITKYSPCNYGLYRTTVGDDARGDMFENVTLRRDIPPETTAPETTAPSETTEQGSVAETTETAKNPDGSGAVNTVGAESVFFIVLAVIAVSGGITALVMMKRD